MSTIAKALATSVFKATPEPTTVEVDDTIAEQIASRGRWHKKTFASASAFGCVLFRFKREQQPIVSVFLKADRLRCNSCKDLDRAYPKPQGCLIQPQHTKLPESGISFPNQFCDLGSNAAPAEAASHKEFDHVPDIWIACDFRPSLHQHKSG